MLALLHAYIGLRLLLPFGFIVQAAGAAVLAGCFWLMPKGFYLRERAGPWAALVPWLAMGFFSWLFVLTLGRDILLAIAALAVPSAAYGQWVRISSGVVMAATPLITAIGFVMARRVAPVVRVTVPLADLPAGLEGFTIAQISDIHVGTTIKGNFV